MSDKKGRIKNRSRSRSRWRSRNKSRARNPRWRGSNRRGYISIYGKREVVRSKGNEEGEQSDEEEEGTPAISDMR